MSGAVRLMCLLLCAACAVSAQEPAPVKRNARPAAEEKAAAEPFDKATPGEMAAKCVTLDTAAGRIEIEMLAEAAPETARNFLNLVATGAFDTTTFSRVVAGFVVQGGNLSTREKLTQELLRRARRTVPDEPNAVKHLRGVVSMARGEEANSATTHFFILVSDSPHLDGTFAAFGRVRAGMEVVDAMNKAEVEGDKPKKPVRLNRATVAACAPQTK
ncbi:MAG TPA: peptidylprolyl isomerase [Pyrinomonadaceae bacterium]|jgi:peptidyl-prolyl cis-trans isomerase B (cyclophilin B)|nr:peptidylprolyl isomerase [Pyrinomonadaceae bacterium]